MRVQNSKALWAVVGMLVCACLWAGPAEACTRAVYFGKNGQTVTGRSMDWAEEMGNTMWVFPRGMARDSGLGKGALTWTSKYGSVAVSVYECGTADGMNEKGLVANMLYLAESEYSPAGDDRPALVISSWAQYMLDNFATVAEAVADARAERYRMVTVTSPDGSAGNVHLSISDTSGDSAIFQYLGGKLVIFHGRQYQVMTNSPIYEQQLALNEYWKHYINAATQSDDPQEAVATVFSVIRNCSVPRGIKHATAPNLSLTVWRTVSDHKNLTYYFENTKFPNVVWVKLGEIDFKSGSGTRKLVLDGRPELAGNQSANFEKTEPFKFLVPH
jgi:penicillin V acylase-like amidase (Ntn superfamily)